MSREFDPEVIGRQQITGKDRGHPFGPPQVLVSSGGQYAMYMGQVRGSESDFLYADFWTFPVDLQMLIHQRYFGAGNNFPPNTWLKTRDLSAQIYEGLTSEDLKKRYSKQILVFSSEILKTNPKDKVKEALKIALYPYIALLNDSIRQEQEIVRALESGLPQ